MVRYKAMGAASIRLVISSGLQMIGSANPLFRVGHFVPVPGALQDLAEEEA